MEVTPDRLFSDSRGVKRCWWCAAAPEYIEYHDREWGFPVTDDVRLFEKICLEGFQAGLSWLTILRKREAFREAFEGFEVERIAEFSERDVVRLLKNPGIVRHRGKIESVINNARRAQEASETFGSLAAYFWRWEPGPDSRAVAFTADLAAAPTASEESRALSKDLKKRGWTFVGATTVYAFMQAMGLVNDHVNGCAAHRRVETARRRLKRPR